MTTIRITTWRMVFAVAVVLIVGAVCVSFGLMSRADKYGVAAERYTEYAESYDNIAAREIGFTTCYGERWDAYSESVHRDTLEHFDDKIYRRAKASHYRRLADTYNRASRHPWISVPHVPPEPIKSD